VYVRYRTEALTAMGNIRNQEVPRESDSAKRQRAHRQGVGRLRRCFSGSDEVVKPMNKKWRSQ
jgi:hypothetical protein